MTNPIHGLNAMVLLGHSSSGKTPVGEILARTLSTEDRTAAHFDFGKHLRAIHTGTETMGLAQAQRAVVTSVMNGQLLGDNDFPIALKILNWFIRSNNLRTGRDMLVCNGLPRHCGQALGLVAQGLETGLVVHLDCTPEDAWARKVLSETGRGHENRSDRPDKAPEVFRRKVASFVCDTLPLLDWYHEHEIPVVKVAVSVQTTPRDVVDTVAKHLQTVNFGA